jgi:hypothetical protein
MTTLPSSQLLRLPPEVLVRVASYLSVDDVSRFSQTCHPLHRSLGLTRLAHVRVLAATIAPWIGSIAHGDRQQQWRKIPPLVLPKQQHRLRRIMFRCRWSDQGWGNRKGRLYIRAFPSSMQVAPRHLYPGHGGRLVCDSPTDAEHHESTLRLSFEPREDEVYYLYYKVGGGGCHTLHVHDATLGVILWDYPDKRLSKQIRESHNNNNNTQLGLPEDDQAGSGTHEQT